MAVRLLNRVGALFLALVLIAPSALAFIMGGGQLALWLVAQQPNQYAAAYPYLADAVPWMAFGFVGLVGSLAVITSVHRSLRWLWFPAITLMYCLLFIPFQPSYGWFIHRAIHPMTTQPIEWAQDLTRYDFRRITQDLTANAKVNGGFACPVDDLKIPSRFMVGGKILMYEVRCVDRAMRPAATSQPTRPALIVMRVSEDRDEAWFQVTTLAHDIGQVVIWLANYGGQDMLIHESLKPTYNTRGI